MLASWFFKPEGKKGKKNERLADPTGKRGEFDVRNAGWYVQDEKANSYPRNVLSRGTEPRDRLSSEFLRGQDLVEIDHAGVQKNDSSGVKK